MTLSKTNLRLDIHKTASQGRITVKKGDTARTFIFTLTENGNVYAPSSDCTAVFTAEKPDGNKIYNQCTISDGRIYYTVTPQSTACAGVMNCEIRLFGADSALLTSPRFTVLVDDTVYTPGDAIESSTEVTAFNSLMSRATAALERMDGIMAASVSVGEDFPDSPGEGEHFICTEDLILYTYDGEDWTETANLSGGVSSVNGQTGAVTLDAEDVGAISDDTPITAAYTGGGSQAGSVFIQDTTPSDAVQHDIWIDTTAKKIKRRGATASTWIEVGDFGGGAVSSVNGQTGAVTLDAEDVGAISDDTPVTAAYTGGGSQAGSVFIQDTVPSDAVQHDIWIDTTAKKIKRRGATASTWIEVGDFGGGAVSSVNGQTGAVTLDAEDVGAIPDDTDFSAIYNEDVSVPNLFINSETPTGAMQNDIWFDTAKKRIKRRGVTSSVWYEIANFGTQKKLSMDSVAAVDTEYYLGTCASLSVTLPTHANPGQVITVDFDSGSTATTLTISGTVIGDTSFAPSSNTSVELNFKYDGSKWKLIVSAVVNGV